MSSETSAEIIRATGRALCKHGYADLTMQRIADESSMTTAAIHYHFDTKRELLSAFLDDLLERFEGKMACDARDPRERLASFLDVIFTPSKADGDDFPVAFMELKAQAPYQDPFRERFLELDDAMRTVVERAVRDGVEAGHFTAADPQSVARFLVTVINGGHVRQVALGEDPAETREAVERYLELQLGWSPEVTA